MTYYLHDFDNPILRLFYFQTFRAGVACLLAFALCVFFGERVIRRLISLKVGQPIRTAEEVHKLSELHGMKGGTPTMGGVMILGAVMIATLLFAPLDNPFVQVMLLALVGMGALGFADDYLKVKRRTSEGISGKMKLAGQGAIAVAISVILLMNDKSGEYIREFYVPFLKDPLIPEMAWWIAVPFFALVIIGCSNAVNLTDGLDGLAIGCTVTVSVTYAMLAYVTGHAKFADYLLLSHNEYVGEVAIFMMALVGAGLGFLWFNCHPAKVFMGDTGSLAIGGMLGTAAICCKQELLLVVVGGVFVMEAASVILQVGSFKLRKKRIFAMSPIHHHFELNGWPESKVIVRFWIISIMCALAGLATLKLR